MSDVLSPSVQTGALPSNTVGDLLAAGKTIQQVHTRFQTATRVPEPRNLKTVLALCLEEAALTGEKCFYGWGVGENRIEGPSIECAMIAFRNWGNDALEMQPIQETQSAYIMTASFIDIERGCTYERQFRQSKKWTVHGKMDEMRKEDVRFQIGQSKAQRNVVLRAVPGWLIDKMIEKAKEGVREKLEKLIKEKGIETARKAVVDALARYSVKLEDIERKYGRYQKWDIEVLITMRGDISALTKGEESAAVLFPPEGEKVDVETGEVTPEPDEKPFNATNGDAAAHQDVKTGKAKSQEGLGF